MLPLCHPPPSWRPPSPLGGHPWCGQVPAEGHRVLPAMPAAAGHWALGGGGGGAGRTQAPDVRLASLSRSCEITTREYCEFMHGYFHEEATLCSQVRRGLVGPWARAARRSSLHALLQRVSGPAPYSGASDPAGPRALTAVFSPPGALLGQGVWVAALPQP